VNINECLQRLLGWDKLARAPRDNTQHGFLIKSGVFFSNFVAHRKRPHLLQVTIFILTDMATALMGENRQLVTDEPVEFEN
jgi:hypothetical protein